MAERLLKVSEVAELLQLRTDRVYALARAGEIPCIRFGRTLRFRRESVDRWLEEQERGNGRE